MLAPDEVESSVAVNISFDAGSRRENPEQAGVATLLQNILLQKLRQIRGEMLKPFEGALNEERASYFSEFSVTRLDYVISALAGQMRIPDINQTHMEAQRLALQNECAKLDERRFGRVQETLLAIHIKRHTWRDDTPITPWVLAVARYKLIDAFRRRGRRVEIEIGEIVDTFAAPEPEAVSEREIRRVLEMLAPGQRSVVAAVSVDGNSINQAARNLGMSETAVRVALHRGLTAIARRFGRN